MAQLFLTMKTKNSTKVSRPKKAQGCFEKFSNYVEDRHKKETKKGEKKGTSKLYDNLCDKLESNGFTICKDSTEDILPQKDGETKSSIANDVPRKKRKSNDCNSDSNEECIVSDSEDSSENQEESTELNAWLEERAAEIQKPLEICRATPELAFLYRTRDDLKKREVKPITEDDSTKLEMSEQDDAELVAMSLVYANERRSLRELETYRKMIKESARLCKFVEPQILFARLKSLCDQSNVNYFRKLCGMEEIMKTNNPDQIQKLKDSCNSIRAAVLEMEDVYRYKLTSYARCYAKPKRIKSYTRPWIAELNLKEED